MKLPAILTMQAMKLPALLPPPPPPPSAQDQMIPISMALVYFLSLRLAFLYFLTLYIIKMSDCEDCQNKNVDVAAKEPTDGLLMTVMASTVAGIFYALRMAGVGQHNALLTSTSVAWLMSLPIWK